MTISCLVRSIMYYLIGSLYNRHDVCFFPPSCHTSVWFSREYSNTHTVGRVRTGVQVGHEGCARRIEILTSERRTDRKTLVPKILALARARFLVQALGTNTIGYCPIPTNRLVIVLTRGPPRGRRLLARRHHYGSAARSGLGAKIAQFVRIIDPPPPPTSLGPPNLPLSWSEWDR